MYNLSKFAHHPSQIAANKYIQTKLPYPHTKDERVEELKRFKLDYQEDPQMLDFIDRVIDRTAAWTEEQYDNYSRVIDVVNERAADKVIPNTKKTAGIEKEWKVQTKTSDDLRSVEVSAVVKGSHGEESWGWNNDESKIIVLRVDSLYQKRPVDQSIIDAAEAVAYNICVEKNAAK